MLRNEMRKAFFSPLSDSYPLSCSRRSGEKGSQRFPSSRHGSRSCHRRGRRSWEIKGLISSLKVKASLVSLEKLKVSIVNFKPKDYLIYEVVPEQNDEWRCMVSFQVLSDSPINNFWLLGEVQAPHDHGRQDGRGDRQDEEQW